VTPPPAKSNSGSFESDILAEWLRELHQNPHFKTDSVGQLDQLETHSKTLLSQITHTISTHPIPMFSAQEFEPIFKLWHGLLAQQSQQGITVRDTAMLILSLKSSVSHWIASRFSDSPPPDTVRQFNTVLDMLGMLTFEVYTNEQQRLIQRQDAHISYLQTKYAQRGPLVSQSPAMATVARAIELVVTTPVTVLIEGETGTGKDVIATTIHQLSNRSKKPFVTVNCGAIPRDLIETELFGHEKGSFTGAERTHIGKFELAHEGTLFLDEIGELPLDLQVKLLRALQNQEIQRVGSTDPISVDVRIIAATNKSLQTEVNLGRFREDLFYRLNVYPIQMPALRQRSEDILPLAHQFLAEASKRFGIPAGVLSDDASHYLLTHNWPGNIRELENVMQRALILAQGGVITASTLTLRPGQIETPLPLLPAAAIPISSTDIIPLEATEAQAIARALKVKNGNILQAARALNISRTTLYAKAKKHGIEL